MSLARVTVAVAGEGGLLSLARVAGCGLRRSEHHGARVVRPRRAVQGGNCDGVLFADGDIVRKRHAWHVCRRLGERQSVYLEPGLYRVFTFHTRPVASSLSSRAQVRYGARQLCGASAPCRRRRRPTPGSTDDRSQGGPSETPRACSARATPPPATPYPPARSPGEQGHVPPVPPPYICTPPAGNRSMSGYI